jgi:hypothetical protein
MFIVLNCQGPKSVPPRASRFVDIILGRRHTRLADDSRVQKREPPHMASRDRFPAGLYDRDPAADSSGNELPSERRHR